jgi:multidrug resistance efflux pump
MKSNITHEQNCQRKSHRLTIPIKAIIDHFTYNVLDWSTQGFKIEMDDETLKRYNVGDKLQLIVLLPTGNSSILLHVKTIIHTIRGNALGLELIEIDDKNKRVLRHYATLAIDGNRNQIEDLSANLFMTNVQTPIQDSVLLSDKESKEVHKKFITHLSLYSLAAIVFFAFVSITLLYNYLVVHTRSGLINGNSHSYTAPYEGKIKNLYALTGNQIEAGQPLFELDMSKETSTLHALQKSYDELLQEQETAQAELQVLKNIHQESQKRAQNIDVEEKKELQALYDIHKKTYEHARLLYEKQLIPFSKYNENKMTYDAYMQRYHDLINRGKSDNKNRLAYSQEILKLQDQILTLQRSVTDFKERAEEVSVEIMALQKQIANAVVFAKESGIVHSIIRKEDEFIKYADKVLTLETKQTPYILTKMLSKEVSAVHIGQPCYIYSEKENTHYKGHITAIGYSITDDQITNTVEISQNEVPIRVDFENPQITFHMNEYLDVYILNDSPIAQKIISLLPKGFLFS